MRVKRYVVAGAVLVASLSLPLLGYAEGNPKARLRRVPACVQCGFRDDCRSCVSGGIGNYCETFNCGACEESGECSGQVMSVIQSAAANRKEPSIPLTIKSRIIRDIGVVHPRFAITLAEMNVYGLSPGDRRVFWTPISLSSSDVPAFLSKESHGRFFKRFNKEVRRLNGLIQTGDLSDIVYGVSIRASDDGSWAIKLQVSSDMTAAASVDPPYSVLEIQVKGTQTVQGVQQQSKTKVTWQIH